MNIVSKKTPIFLIFALFCFAVPSLAEKTDMIFLRNGSRLYGEIRKMDRGRLIYSTDEMKVVYVDWVEIARISSSNIFDVEMASGLRYHGSLGEASEEGKIVVVSEKGRITEDLLSVVNIIPLDSRFWQLFKGSLSFGFNFQKAKSLTTLTAGSDITCYTKNWEARLESSNYFSKQEDTERITRNSAVLTFNKFLPKQWSIVGLAQVQQNDQLSLDLRAILGGTIGKYMIKNNRMVLMALAGLTVTHEKYTGSESSRNGSEAVFALDFQAFRYHSPDLQFKANVKVYPSISDFGRVRIEFNSSFYYEILKSFYFTLGFFDQYDSHPPRNGDIAKNDYGVDVSLSWKFY